MSAALGEMSSILTCPESKRRHRVSYRSRDVKTTEVSDTLLFAQIGRLHHEEVVCDYMCTSLLQGEYEKAVDYAKEIPDLQYMMARCDQNKDRSLILTLGCYGFRVALAHRNVALQNKLYQFIYDHPETHHLVSKAFHKENVFTDDFILEEIKSKLAMILAFEGVARRYWAGYAMYYDPTKNTVQGWLEMASARRSLIEMARFDEIDSITQSYHGWGDDAVVDAVLNEGGHEDPVFDALANRLEQDDLTPSVLSVGDLDKIGLAFGYLIGKYGWEGVEKGVGSLLRYHRRSVVNIMARKGFVVDMVACLMVVHPILIHSLFVDEIDGHWLVLAGVKAADFLRGILPGDAGAVDSGDWMVMAAKNYADLRDSFAQGGDLNLSKIPVVNGVRQFKDTKKRLFRRTIGAFLLDAGEKTFHTVRIAE